MTQKTTAVPKQLTLFSTTRQSRYAVFSCGAQADGHVSSSRPTSLFPPALQYFGNEDHEAERYDTALAKYQQASLKTTTRYGGDQG